MEPSEIEDLEVELFVEALRLRHGYDFRNYARASLKRRVLEVKRETGSETLVGLLPRLFYEPGFLGEVIARLSVPVTEMFRDPQVFATLRREVVPVLRTFPRINVWQAGCATGEEVYSLAILLQEEGLLERSQIYATDINDKAIQVAEEGVYPIKNLREYSRNYQLAGGKASLADYFHARYDFAKMDEVLRKNIVFAHHNLAADGVFCEVQMILCRNVFIYFDKELQRKVLRLFRDSLTRGGILCLGLKETLRFSDVEHEFQAIAQKEMIFRKRPQLGALS